MKACPACARLFPDDALFCPEDGTLLQSAEGTACADSDDKRVGTTLKGQYQIRRVVADGGMGRVYEALDLINDRNIAIKILHQKIARDEVQVERFKREYEVSAELKSPFIVKVYEFFATSDGSYALVMEFLFGEELRAVLARNCPIPSGRMVRMVSQIALGLSQAHQINLVHRDLKPDNIFLCQTHEGDQVKLLDFGSVKDKGIGAKQLTVMGTTIGSPYYMAPEQAQGLETLDRRADIWALAAICFECLTGTVPFGPGEGPQILLKILTSEPSPLNESLCPGFPEQPLSLDLVLGQAFKKIPSLRQETVGQFANALGQALGLVGSHNNWASLSERELTQSILQQLPRLMNEQAREQGHSIQDDFFGDEDSLGELNRASTEHPNTDQISMTSNLSLLSDKATGRVIQGVEPSSPATLKNELPVENLFRNKWVIVSFLILTLLIFLYFFFT